MSNIIDSIQLSGTTYAIQCSGGEKAIEAGRGISITTGETADTVSFNLPISAGTGSNSIAEGFVTTANGNYGSHAEGFGTNANGDTSHAEGYYSTAQGDYSHAEGGGTIAKNLAEHASGRFNNSVSASTTFGNSGNTLFSVGNGTADSARHNAFEIRQNGDIYLSLNGQDVKLQDQLGGGSITVDNALSPTSENPVQNKVLYDELRIVEGSELVLEWENNDGGDTLNYPIGTSTLEFYVDESQMTYGHFNLISNAEQGEVGGITIESNSGVITVSDEWSIDYTISGNVVTVSYPTVASTVDYLNSSYDCYWTVKAVNKTVTPLIDKVGEIEEVTAAGLNNINDRLSEDEEVTAAALNALNDTIGNINTILESI